MFLNSFSGLEWPWSIQMAATNLVVVMHLIVGVKTAEQAHLNECLVTTLVNNWVCSLKQPNTPNCCGKKSAKDLAKAQKGSSRGRSSVLFRDIL